jgi:hypothetical protein
LEKRAGDEGKFPHTPNARAKRHASSYTIEDARRVPQDRCLLGASQMSHPLHAPEYVTLGLIEHNAHAAAANIVKRVDLLRIIRRQERLAHGLGWNTVDFRGERDAAVFLRDNVQCDVGGYDNLFAK